MGSYRYLGSCGVVARFVDTIWVVSAAGFPQMVTKVIGVTQGHVVNCLELLPASSIQKIMSLYPLKQVFRKENI